MRTGRLGVTGLIRICGLIVVLILSISLCAQNRQGRTNTNSGSAVLHIQVNVIPTVLSQKTQPQPTSSSSISYVIPVVTNQDQTLVQESQLTPSSASCASLPCSGVLRTTTIVAH